MNRMQTLVSLLQSHLTNEEIVSLAKDTFRPEVYNALMDDNRNSQMLVLQIMSSLIEGTSAGATKTPLVEPVVATPVAPVPVIPAPVMAAVPIQTPPVTPVTPVTPVAPVFTAPVTEPVVAEVPPAPFVSASTPLPVVESPLPVYPEPIVEPEPLFETEPSVDMEEDFSPAEESPMEEVLAPIQEEPSTPAAPIYMQQNARKWEFAADSILVQQCDIEVIRNGVAEQIRFYVSPLQLSDNELVPILVNAEYQTEYGIKQTTTQMSQDGCMLTMDVSKYSFLIRGAFENGRFNISIISTGRSVEAGDIVNLKATYPSIGTAAVPKLELNDKTTLWISFTGNQYFGMLQYEEWLDEYNATHDAMVATNDDFSELSATKTGNTWTLEF